MIVLPPTRLLLKTATTLMINASVCLVLHAQDAQWIKQIGGSFDDGAGSVTTDSAGNIYTTGTLGAWNGPGGYVDGHFHTVAGTRDIFVAKFDAEGNYQWSVTAGGSKFPSDINEQESGYFIQYHHNSGTIVVLGAYDSNSNPSVFGPTLSVLGKGMFLAGYSVNGECLWLQTVPFGSARSMAIDDQGVIYVQGRREEIANDSFIRTYAGDGTPLDIADLGVGVLGSLMITNEPAVVMAGTFNNEAVLFGSSLLPVNTIHNPLLVRMDASMQTALNIQQVRATGLASFVSVLELDNYLFTTGSFADTMFFGNDTLVAPSGTYQPFLAKHDNSGVPVWIQTFNGLGDHYSLPYARSTADGSIYLTMTIAAPVTIGTFQIDPTASREFVLARFDTSGNCLGVVHGGVINGAGVDLLVTPDGGIVICGQFSGTLQLGNGITSNGARDGFVAKLDAITGIQHLAAPGGGLHIYANPNNGLCTIDLPETLRPSNDLFLSVYDNTGQLVQRAPLQFTDGGIRLDVRAQAKGIYHVELGDGRQRYTGTIVFE